MHFWIDKRSPQCGFGRSRVAASLHTGGSGLSFGHPPRRSGGHKSSSTSSNNTSLSASSNAAIQVHRQHHQASVGTTGAHYPHTTHAGATTSSSSGQYRGAYYNTGNSTPITSSNNNNNSNTAVTNAAVSASTNHSTNRNFIRSNVNTAHHYYNNNRQHPTSGHHHHHQTTVGNQTTTAINSSSGLPNSSNNNITSPTGNNLNSSLNNTLNTAATTTGVHHQLQQQQRYRHPQFGNMSVRTYQPSIQQSTTATTNTTALTHLQHPSFTQLPQSTTNISGTTATTTNTLQHHAMTTTVGAAAAAAAIATANELQQSLDTSLNTLNEHGIQHQSPHQIGNVSAELYHQTSSPRIVTSLYRPITAASMSTASALCDYNNARSNYSNSALSNTSTSNNVNQLQHHHHHTQSHTRQRRAARSIESTDLQFLPLHLKCGIFASLVLAIAFIVGIKVYFDNHGTKFEVGLFWLLTATFVFAFCFVSICKVPRVLFASTTSSRSNSRDQTTRDRCSMDEVAAVASRGSMVNSIDDVVITGLHEFQQEQIQSININAQAGPPPYHIAILLPETKANKEDITALEESPPPSYDKILI